MKRQRHVYSLYSSNSSMVLDPLICCNVDIINFNILDQQRSFRDVFMRVSELKSVEIGRLFDMCRYSLAKYTRSTIFEIVFRFETRRSIDKIEVMV